MSEAVLTSRPLTLLELLDRLLETGVVADGKVTLSVADVDLIYLGVRLVLSSVGTLEQHADLSAVPCTAQAGKSRPGARELTGQRSYLVDAWPTTDADTRNPSHPAEASAGGNGHQDTVDRHSVSGGHETPGRSVDNLKVAGLPAAPKSRVKGAAQAGANGRVVSNDRAPRQPRLDIEPEKVERGLAKLVLTIVELLRRLMESQAVRRMDQGMLSDGEIERLGQAFSQLEARMEDLKKVFGLEDEELNLDLGPIGKLV